MPTHKFNQAKKLGIGTVQFGAEYGISNSTGRPSIGEVARILEIAADFGSDLLDTAALYGESEKILGSALPLRHNFRIVTKTAQFKKEQITAVDVELLKQTFHVSLLKLRQTSVYGLLAHHADDLLAPGGEQLFEQMSEFKRQRMVRKIGASVYRSDQIDALLARFPIDIVQLPINLMDQRLIVSGHLRRLKSAGVEIHSRSAFLQGLLLIPPPNLPEYFHPVQGLLSAYNSWLYQHELSPLEGALMFVGAQKEIDCTMVGVCSSKELEEITRIWSRLTEQPIDMSSFQCDDEQYVNPALWKVNR